MGKQNKMKVMYQGREVEAIDCTPTWVGILPLLLDTHEAASSRMELKRMAKTADEFNRLMKEMKGIEEVTIDILKKLIAIIKDPDKIEDNLKTINEVEDLIKQYEAERKLSNKG